MGEPGISFARVWKKFRRGERHDSLRDVVVEASRKILRGSACAPDLQAHEFWAVRDVSFEVGPGEALGIIGPNGAGKSTTLKLLTRILKPTVGRCQIRGRAGALIEVAAGFHPDLTGRENVFLQGAIMGMKRAEIVRRFDAIVEFAGVSAFVDTPVKRYSSGMNARLGFAIAAHLDPDVMIIDEVLSVGDAAFQEKCVRQMQKMVTDGVPVVFVSHNLPAILELCTKAVVFQQGSLVFSGDPASAIQHYRRTAVQLAAADEGQGPLWISAIELVDEEGQQVDVVRTNGSVTVRIHYTATQPVTNPYFAVDIHNGSGVYCYGTGTFQGRPLGRLLGRGTMELRLSRLVLLPGPYSVSVGIHRGGGQDPYDLRMNAVPFSVASERRDHGVVALDPVWVHHSESPGDARTGVVWRSD